MESVWTRDIVPPEFKSLSKDIKTDALIIGGGLSGILCACALKSAGIDCVIAEKEWICSGNTAGTTAKITAQHGAVYSNLIKKFGKERARMYLDANLHAVSKYKTISRRIDCDAQTYDACLYSLYDRSLLEREAEALITLGYNATIRESLALPFETSGAVVMKNQFSLNPLKLLYALCGGLTIYENTMITSVKGNAAYTSGGNTITAENIIFCSHFPFVDRKGMYFVKMYQSRSFVYELANVPPVNAMYRDADENGLSFRPVKDHLLFSGGQRKTGDRGGGYRAVKRSISEYYPNAEIILRFAAQDCMTLDSIPYIGRYSGGKSRWYVMTGFNKWGFTNAMTGAGLICDMIIGRENDYAPLYSPQRSIMKPQLLINGGRFIKNSVGFAEKRCTHMGCKLRYNSTDGTWECPCHGSRYDRRGNIIDAPATKKLK